MKHREQHLQSSILLRDLVIGISDGLTVPFALAAGLSSAVSSNGIILTAGLAELAAGSLSMGLGGYLAGRTDVEHYQGELKREYREVEEIPEEEKQEVRAVFSNYGISDEVKEALVTDLARDKDRWVDFMMRFELGLEKPDRAQAARSAFSVGGAYAVGALIPLSAYFFTATPRQGLFYSSVITMICLWIFGYAKSRFTGQPPVAGGFRMLIVGTLAALAAFGIAQLVRF